MRAGTRPSTAPTASRSRRLPSGSASSTRRSNAYGSSSPRTSASFQGEFFELTDARCDPKPVQQRLPLWIGGAGEKVTLRIAAQHADGWNITFHAPDDYRHKVAVLEAHCERASRDPASITKSVNLTVAADDSVLRARFGGTADYIRPSALMGSPQQMVDRIGEYADAGADWVILALRAPFDLDELDRFAADVLPNAS